MAAGIDAAKSAQPSGPAASGGASGSSTQASIDKMVAAAVRKAMSALPSPGGGPSTGPQPKRKGKGRGKGAKGNGKGKPTPAPAAGTPAVAKKLKSRIQTLSVKKKFCIKYNKGECTVADCPYPHRCAICDDEACAAHYHAEELA